jgi:ribosomal protein S18 acetylase RimI-like enzyme
MTSSEIRYALSTASVEALIAHLEACDKEFDPPLSSYVDIRSYAVKIKTYAMLFEVWQGDILKALLAAYVDRKAETIFITDLSVTSDLHGQGVAHDLMQRCLDHAKTNGFRRIRLEVWNNNGRAMSFYIKQGFRVVEATDRSKMELVIHEQ